MDNVRTAQPWLHQWQRQWKWERLWDKVGPFVVVPVAMVLSWAWFVVMWAAFSPVS